MILITMLLYIISFVGSWPTIISTAVVLALLSLSIPSSSVLASITITLMNPVSFLRASIDAPKPSGSPSLLLSARNASRFSKVITNGYSHIVWLLSVALES